MAKSIRDLVASVMDPGDGVLPEMQVFPPLNVDQIAGELRLEERAEKAGREGQPPSQADGPDMVELDILDCIERLARKAHEVYLSQIDQYEGRIRRAIATADLRVQIEAAGSSALADIEAEIIRHQNHLNLLLRAVVSREEEFRRFRQQHGLTRYPMYFSRDQRALALLLLLVFILLEALLTGLYFSGGTDAVLSQVAMLALVLSILNIGVASFYALYGFQYLFHRQLGARVMGILVTLAFALWVIELNLTVGHARDLFMAGRRVLLSDLWNRLSSAPLTLNDMQSLSLFLLGFVLAHAAVVVIAANRDRYPGYSAVGRDLERALKRFTSESARYLSEIKQLRDRAVDDMTSAVLLIRGIHLSMLRVVEARSRAHQIYVDYLNQLAGVHERLVQRYRELNLRIRQGEAPAYFQKPALRPLLAEPPKLPSVRGLEEDVRKEVIARIDYYIKAVNDRLEEALPKYRLVEEVRN